MRCSAITVDNRSWDVTTISRGRGRLTGTVPWSQPAASSRWTPGRMNGVAAGRQCLFLACRIAAAATGAYRGSQWELARSMTPDLALAEGTSLRPAGRGVVSDELLMNRLGVTEICSNLVQSCPSRRCTRCHNRIAGARFGPVWDDQYLWSVSSSGAMSQSLDPGGFARTAVVSAGPIDRRRA